MFQKLLLAAVPRVDANTTRNPNDALATSSGSFGCYGAKKREWLAIVAQIATVGVIYTRGAKLFHEGAGCLRHVGFGTDKLG